MKSALKGLANAVALVLVLPAIVLYWLGALVQYATGSRAYIAATSFVLVGLNLLALGVWARLAAQAIRQPSLRVAALVTLAFLPVRVIHTTVFAPDAVVVLPFTLMLWLSCELFRAADPRRPRGGSAPPGVAAPMALSLSRGATARTIGAAALDRPRPLP